MYNSDITLMGNRDLLKFHTFDTKPKSRIDAESLDVDDEAASFSVISSYTISWV